MVDPPTGKSLLVTTGAVPAKVDMTMKRQTHFIVSTIAALALAATVSSEPSSVIPRRAFRVRPLPTTRFIDSNAVATSPVLALRGGNQAALVAEASNWVGSLAGPASMISGAVLSNLYQNMRADAELSVKPGDPGALRIIKKLAKFLLASSFAMVISCIFFSLITRSMLMALPPVALNKIYIDETSTPMSVLQQNFEFEYLTCQILMGQGLLNWLASIALTFAIPLPNQPVSVRKMNSFLSTLVICMILVMISFFNNHLLHYSNYAAMLFRWMHIMLRKFVWHWPLLPMAYVIGPAFVLAVYRGLDVFIFNADHEDKLDVRLN